MNLSTAVEVCDLPALMRQHCGAEALRGLGARGGTIHDPRPGMSESSPSFSVWRTPRGLWMWKKRGKNAGGGTAFNFLTSLGLNGSQARRVLLEFAGVSAVCTGDAPPASQRAPQKPAKPMSVLATARERLAELKPALHRQVQDVMRSSQPLSLDSAAGQDLLRRGLWPPGDLGAVSQGGHLLLILRSPQGRVMNLKRRKLHGEGKKYALLFAGIGTPPWVNPGYGQAERVLLIEGELNAAAAWRVITEHGLNLDVQGLAGSDTWPYLDGLDREVWIYADADSSGDGMRARLQDLAFECGAPRVHHVACLPVGTDFCDLLGSAGSLALLEHLLCPSTSAGHQKVDVARSPRSALTFQPAPLLGEGNTLPEWPLAARARPT